MVKKLVMQASIVLILLVAVLYLCLRLWPEDKNRWHVDPADTTDPRRSGVRLIGPDAPRFPGDADTVLGVIVDIVKASPRTRRVDGSIDEGMITFVVRSRTMGFRDYVTFKAVSEGGLSKLAVYARPGMNVYDWGTNAALLDDWLLKAQQTLDR